MKNNQRTVYDTSQPLPTLSTKGWVYGLNEKVDLIFAYYLASQHSQSLHHRGHVKSFQYTVKNYYSDPWMLSKTVQNELEELLKHHIENVQVEVTHKARDTGPQVDYFIKMDLIHAGYRWENFKSVGVNGSKFELLTNINNVGKVSLV